MFPYPPSSGYASRTPQWNTWPSDDWCSWPRTGYCCSTYSTVATVVAPQITPTCWQSFRWLGWFQTCLLVGKFSWNFKSIGMLSVVQYGICPGVTYDLLTILLRFWMNICPCWLDVIYQPWSSVCVTRISLGFKINAGTLLVSSRRLIFGETSVHSRVYWKEFIHCQVRANKTYSEAKRQFSNRNRDVLMNVHPLISGGPLLRLRCSAWVRHCLRLLVRVVDWCASRLVRLIGCRIVLTATSCHPSPSITQ